MIPPLLLALLGYAISREPLGAACMLVLYVSWRLLRGIPGPPILPIVVAFHWIQTSLGVFYAPLSGRQLLGTTATEYRMMVMIGLGCVLALAAGLRLGVTYMRRSWPDRTVDVEVFSIRELVVGYVIALFATGVLQSMAWSYPLFTQPMVASTTIRLGLLYFLLRRLLMPEVQPIPIAALLGFEMMMGITGFFASFREPVLFAGIAFVEAFNRRRVSHWIGMTAIVAAAGGASLFWMGVRGEYRQDFADVELFSESRSMRLARLRELGTQWRQQELNEMLYTADFLVDRVWAIYYPALALERVPSLIPHTGGDIIWRAVVHISMPRVLFPNKPPVGSDSELVRRYSGVYVAGEETNTSIAFGYAGESYVDFGVPFMFIPVFVWALFLGMSYHFLFYLIRHNELRVPLLVVVFWMSLSQFERSWAKTMGLTGTLLIYLGGFTYLVDRWLIQRYVSHTKAASLTLAK